VGGWGGDQGTHGLSKKKRGGHPGRAKRKHEGGGKRGNVDERRTVDIGWLQKSTSIGTHKTKEIQGTDSTKNHSTLGQKKKAPIAAEGEIGGVQKVGRNYNA